MSENTNLSNSEIKDSWVLKEILHKPVTFNADSIQRDTDDLNNAIRKGYKINEIVKTETGIVYVLSKWKKNKSIVKSTVKSKVQLERQRNSWNIFTGGSNDQSN